MELNRREDSLEPDQSQDLAQTNQMITALEFEAGQLTTNAPRVVRSSPQLQGGDIKALSQDAGLLRMELEIVNSGKFTEARYIKTGGEGAVFQLTDKDGNLYAGKLISIVDYARFSNRAGFLKEELILPHLEHKCVCRYHDTFSLQDGMFHLIVREWAAGDSLRSIIDRDGALPFATALPIFRNLLETINYLHEPTIREKGEFPHSVIHRDIKPSNIVVDTAGNVKLIDFGISRISGLTETFTSKGSMLYADPDQRHGVPTKRSDIYALGISMIEILTGEYPQGINDISAPQYIVPKHENIPEQLRSILQKMITRDQKTRYNDVASILEDCAAVGQSDGMIEESRSVLKTFTDYTRNLVEKIGAALRSTLAGFNSLLGSEPEIAPTAIFEKKLREFITDYVTLKRSSRISELSDSHEDAFKHLFRNAADNESLPVELRRDFKLLLEWKPEDTFEHFGLDQQLDSAIHFYKQEIESLWREQYSQFHHKNKKLQLGDPETMRQKALQKLESSRTSHSETNSEISLSLKELGVSPELFSERALHSLSFYHRLEDPRDYLRVVFSAIDLEFRWDDKEPFKVFLRPIQFDNESSYRIYHAIKEDLLQKLIETCALRKWGSWGNSRDIILEAANCKVDENLSTKDLYAKRLINSSEGFEATSPAINYPFLGQRFEFSHPELVEYCDRGFFDGKQYEKDRRGFWQDHSSQYLFNSFGAVGRTALSFRQMTDVLHGIETEQKRMERWCEAEIVGVTLSNHHNTVPLFEINDNPNKYINSSPDPKMFDTNHLHTSSKVANVLRFIVKDGDGYGVIEVERHGTYRYKGDLESARFSSIVAGVSVNEYYPIGHLDSLTPPMVSRLISGKPEFSKDELKMIIAYEDNKAMKLNQPQPSGLSLELLKDLPAELTRLLDEGRLGLIGEGVRGMFSGAECSTLEFAIFDSESFNDLKGKITASSTDFSDPLCFGISLAEGKKVIIRLRADEDASTAGGSAAIDLDSGVYSKGTFYLPNGFEESIKNRLITIKNSDDPEDTFEKINRYRAQGYEVDPSSMMRFVRDWRIRYHAQVSKANEVEVSPS